MERATDQASAPSSSQSVTTTVPKMVTAKSVNTLLKSGLVKIKRKRCQLLCIIIAAMWCIYSESSDNNVMKTSAAITTNKKQRIEGINLTDDY